MAAARLYLKHRFPKKPTQESKRTKERTNHVRLQESFHAECGRGTSGPRPADPHRVLAFPQSPRAEGTLSAGPGDGGVRAWLLLGRRAQVLGTRRRRLCNGGRLCWRFDAQSDL